MSDGMQLFLLAFVFALIPFCIQLLICRFCRSKLVRLLPLIVFFPIWAICTLGTFNIIDLPYSSVLSESSFIAFADYAVITLIGTPALIGLILAWALCGLLGLIKKQRA